MTADTWERRTRSALALHFRAPYPHEDLCDCCRTPWPCATVLALTGRTA